MELRVPGIGGPSPESVLDCPPNHAVATWRSEDAARSMVRHAAGEVDVHVYDWRPLTSGSRSFAVWPLLAPFTLVNIAGWMGPPNDGRAWLHRWATVLLGFAVTVQCTVWLVVLAVCGSMKWLGHPSPPATVTARGVTKLIDTTTAIPFVLAIVAAAAAMGVLITGATYAAAGFDRFRPRSWDAAPAPSALHPWGKGIRLTVDDPRFFDSGAEHRVHWYFHVAAATLTMAAVALVVWRHGDPAAPWAALNGVVIAAGTAPFAAIALIGLADVLPDDSGRRLWARLSAVGAAVLGVLLLGGLASAGLIAIVGIDHVPAGASMMMFDLYGWVAVGALALTLYLVAFAVQAPSVAEAPPPNGLLGSLMARLRARVAPTVGDADIVLALVGVAAPIAAAALAWTRWFDADDPGDWRLTGGIGVAVARWTVFGLAGLMILNLVKSRANPESLRRIGNVWDVITFWPRSFQPFAVRPYAERAVPELREFVLRGPQRPPLVVTAHSQGSVLAYAALAPVHADVPDHTALVTFGSPLRDLYAKFFPRSFPTGALAETRRRLGGRWRNVFRFTDHVGRAVFSEDDVALARYLAATADDLADLADLPLPDPSPTDPTLEGHNRYWASTEVGAAVKALTDG